MKPLPVLSRPAAFALLLAFWAAIYLPGLGSVEIKGEEIRRIMPGVNMLESGDWIVPRYNGNVYLRKPPLVNWAIALSIKLFGVRDEFTARFPSVLALLALGLVMLACLESWLGINTALAAVLIVFTTAGIVEKGRLAEIESIYISLFGMAFACWLGGSAVGRSRWVVWPATGILLGLGLLAKGPPHLAFFYAIAGFISWCNWRRGKAGGGFDTGLLSWAHLCGILLMLGVFALWCVPYMHHPATIGAGGVWARQMEQRVGGGAGSTIFLNFLHSLLNFLPWGLALPLFWRRAALERLNDRDRLIVQAARWPVAVCAFALMFVPGMLPRYTLPLVVPYALLLALLLKGMMGEASLRWPLMAAGIAGTGMIIYGVFFAGWVAEAGAARAFAARINALMPAGSAIYIFDPSVQPQVFYIHGRLMYQDSVKMLPGDVPWLLAPASALKLLRGRFRESHILDQMQDIGRRKFVLLSLHGHGAPLVQPGSPADPH